MKIPSIAAALTVLVLIGGGCASAPTKPEDAGRESAAQSGRTRDRDTDEKKKVVSCISVLATKGVKNPSSTLKMTVDGVDFPVELDGSATYEKNPVWDAGAAPSICGYLKTKEDGKTILILVAQLHQSGTPVVRLQLGTIPVGENNARGSSLIGYWRDPSSAATWVLSPGAGKVTVTPSTSAPGVVDVRFDEVSGNLIGATPKKFTLSGTITGTFEGTAQPK
jgi:hypothetical protein